MLELGNRSSSMVRNGMLSDDEIQVVANQSTTPDLHEFVAVWQCELQDPPGVYFVLQHRDARETAPGRLETVGLLGSAGFFVYRATGEVRGFPGVEFAQAYKVVEQDYGRCEFPEDLPKVISHILQEASGRD